MQGSREPTAIYCPRAIAEVELRDARGSFDAPKRVEPVTRPKYGVTDNISAREKQPMFDENIWKCITDSNTLFGLFIPSEPLKRRSQQ